LKCETVSLLSV